MRVYVVDDDPLVLMTIMAMLDDESVETEAFGSATAFLAALDSLPLGCVLLDIGMPDLNGHDVLGEVVARRPFPSSWVSGSADVDDAIRSFRGGAVHFIRKPFVQSALLATLQEAWQIGLERRPRRASGGGEPDQSHTARAGSFGAMTRRTPEQIDCVETGAQRANGRHAPGQDHEQASRP